MDKTFALLIGINYIGQSGELNGCINDVKDVKSTLVTKFGIDANNIVVMSDDKNKNSNNYPTRKNILSRLIHFLVKAHRKELDRLIVHYSGHGYYVKDKNNDEEDEWDEVICPVDYSSSGFIKDDLLNAIFRVFPDVDIFAIIDACNSGTSLDLKYRHVFGDQHTEEESDLNMKPRVTMISGCRDDQESADAYISGRYNGALTKAYLEALEDTEFNVTYFDLLEKIRGYLKRNNFTQVPQLSSSFKLTSSSIYVCPKNCKPFISI